MKSGLTIDDILEEYIADWNRGKVKTIDSYLQLSTGEEKRELEFLLSAVQAIKMAAWRRKRRAERRTMERGYVSVLDLPPDHPRMVQLVEKVNKELDEGDEDE